MNKMSRNIWYLVVLFAVVSQPLFAWGNIEHDAIAYIAECNLKPEAKKRIESYLGGRSIVYYATWMDHVRKTPEFIFSDTWHMSWVDENFKLIDAPNKETYRCVQYLEEIIENLTRYQSLDDSTVAVSIKFLIHLVGDMHCPSHVRYSNRTSFPVKFNGENVSYHSVWDKHLLRYAQSWSYIEYQHQLDRRSATEISQIVQGTPKEWFEQTARDSIVIYDWAKRDEELGMNFMLKARTLAENQIMIAGYRLAHLLNNLFG